MRTRAVPQAARAAPSDPTVTEVQSLFERFSWVYAFCRERVFRDDTDLIAAVLWGGSLPDAGCRLLDLGCGPGFYALRLAGRYTGLRVLGIDRSARQLGRARALAAARCLDNCSFEQADVGALSLADGVAGVLVASRLFMILPEPELALREMYRVLRPGGRAFIAEPRAGLRAGAPLRALWLLAQLRALGGGAVLYDEPRTARVLGTEEFEALINSQPWRHVRVWRDASYQYAVCEKGSGEG